MPSQFFLISNFRTGFDEELQPWLLPQDAFVEMVNYRTQRGVIKCREGLTGFAQGGKSTAKNQQSRIYTTTTGESVVDTQTTFVHTLASPVRPGSVTFTDNTGGTALTATDDGTGGFTGDFSSGTINYLTGVVSATWSSGPTAPITVTYTHANASIKVTNEDIADTGTASGTLSNTPVRRGSVVFYDGGTQWAYDNGAGALTGNATAGGISNYATGAYSITWTVASGSDAKVSYAYKAREPVQMIANYITATNTQELIVASTNQFNKYNANLNTFDPISVTGSGTANPTGDDTQFFSWTNYRDKSNNPRLVMVNDKVSDRIYTYDGTNINRFQNSGDFGDVAGSSWSGNLATALHVYFFGERLFLVRPRTTNQLYGNRCVWSGINSGTGNGDDFNAPGANFLELDTEHFITASQKLRNAIILWTTEGVFEVTVSTNIDLPFRVKQIGDAVGRGSQSPFSGVTWFGESAAIGAQGIVGTDGREAYRVDNKIPFFTRDRMNGLSDAETFSPYDIITSGTVFEYDQFWFTYADINHVSEELCTDVLAHNFVEESWCTYDMSLSRIGQFKETDETIWDDVDEDRQDSWAAWDTTTEIWDSFFNQASSFFTCVGDKCGFIYQLTNETDQCAQIEGISKASAAVIDTEPDLFEVGDIVKINDVSGMTEINNISATVTAVNSDQVTIGIDSSEFTTYTSGGVICKIIPREMISKPFNPFREQNKKCRLKKVHFFIDTDRTSMQLDLFADKRGNPYRQDIPIDDGTNEGGSEKKWTSISVNQVANSHTLRIHSEAGAASEELHAIMLECEPVGRLYR